MLSRGNACVTTVTAGVGGPLMPGRLQSADLNGGGSPGRPKPFASQQLQAPSRFPVMQLRQKGIETN